MVRVDRLLRGAGEVFTGGPDGILTDVSVGMSEGVITYIGPPSDVEASEVIDLDGRLLTPGLVDPHTHLVFAGDRADEYALRAAGTSYLQIAKAGGGIARTMRATRAASADALAALARPRLDALLRCGVTTAEVKSGYGLTLDDELKMLEVVRRLDAEQPIALVATFLGAHTVPPEARGDRQGYLDRVVDEMIPAVAAAGLAAFCDVFVEEGAFTLDEAERVLRAGIAHGLRPKVHADQLSPGGGAELAARLRAVSADHLEHVSDFGIKLLAEAGTVAVLLPGAAMFLGGDERPPARALIDHGVPVALATDCNPGTCMTENLLLMLTLGMSRLGMTPVEVLDAVTRHAARAVGREAVAGTIALGRPADLAVFDVPSHRHLPYRFGAIPTWQVYKDGERVYAAG
ncbi:MAG: imidazolonepropionase [bacterium]|nr:imidazolonepropionase [Myxococcales bacterium]MCB9542620.1 imidazolonepropionase [Myxococcales bacterium]